MAIGVLPHENHEVSGCLHKSDTDKPTTEGALLYFNAQGRLDQAIAAVEPNGGKVLKSKHALGLYGFRAIVLDSEGNRIALHSM
jgi:predicted enzyme related to lactoylglutathione lyase